jgi:ATP-binding cassette, subfamily C (CFTR/MRP), member 1
LYDINLSARKGHLLGVFGRVGSGKSSLLSAIVGEMIRIDGEVVLRGSVAYVPQTPWIMSASVRDNILFSHEWDEEFYELVLDGEYHINRGHG